MAEGFVSLRIGIEREGAILSLVEAGEYKNLSAFVIEAIDEKLGRENNSEVHTRLKRQLFDLIRNDPERVSLRSQRHAGSLLW